MAQDTNRAVTTGKRIARKSGRVARRAVRRFFSLVWDTIKTTFGIGQRRVGKRRSNRSITGRYINDLIAVAETNHLTGRHVDLSKVLVEPEFMPAPELIEPVAEDDVVQEVFYVVPRVPDHPYLAAPYHVHTFRVEELLAGHRQIALLGLPGSGRTTALMAILLWVVREITFDPKPDMVQQQIEEEEANLSEKERRAIQQRRKEMLEAAREQLIDEIKHGQLQDAAKSTRVVNAGEAAEADKQSEVLPVSSLLPIYIHMADLNVTRGEFGGSVDPAEPLVRALQRQVSNLTARTIPRQVYNQLANGSALVLIDGYDDLPPTERDRAHAWLNAFMGEYGHNFVIVTGPATAYGPLLQAGLMPTFIRPWSQRHTQESAEKWAENWPLVTGTRRSPGPEVEETAQEQALTDTMSRSTLELTLKIWATYHGKPDGIDTWIEHYIEQHLPRGQSMETMRELLVNAAVLQTELGFITASGLTVLMHETTRGTQPTAALAILETADQHQVDAPDEMPATDEEEDEDDELWGPQLRSLIFSGLLHAFRGRRYQFVHPDIAAYLASYSLAEAGEQLWEIAEKPEWERAIQFALLHTDIDDVVKMHLMAHPDMSQSNVLTLTRWLAYTTEEPAWRGELFKRLGNLFIHPKQFSATRERIAAALVGSRDRNGALVIFRTALTNPTKDVRRLGCLGAGAFRATQVVDEIAALLRDPEQDVQLAAAHALGAIGTEEALDEMVGALMDGQERLQQAVAETFAMMPEQGYATLHEAINHEAFMIRRAAVFGLRRVHTQWAREDVHRSFVEDEEWYVHSAAQEAFLSAEAGPDGPKVYPLPDEITWLSGWARARGHVFEEGDEATEALLAALQDQNPQIRELAAISLGQLGTAQAVQPLYNALTDPQRNVREAAHQALVDLQIKIGQTLPDPM